MSQENTLRATLTPSGFHRTISVTIPHLTADHDDCTCHIYLALPAAMFVDPYELALYHEIFTFEYWGTRDLERPVAAVSQADSLVLISPRDTNNRTREITVDIPIHSRYGDLRLYERPGWNVGYQEVALEHPYGLMRCPISSTRKSQLGKLDGIPQQIERHFNTSNGFILTSLPATLNTCNRPAVRWS
ncbi:PIG-X [Infundibulicybe gibba]|nr:PIG-X [Infundibulicybe gibba]